MVDKMDGKIKDITLAEFGRREIELAEVEMPGLMGLRSMHGSDKPLRGAKIMGSLHMTIQTAVLIETLKYLGADVRWCSCNIFSTQDHAAAAVLQKGSAAVFAWKGETLEEYWWCTAQALTWPDADGPDMIVDDGSDATLLVHMGVAAEKKFEATGEVPDPCSVEGEMSVILSLLKETLKIDPSKWRRMASAIIGCSEETTTGVHRLREMAKKNELLFTAINVNDCVTKSKFDNVYGCRHSLPDGIMRSTDVMIGGKKVLIFGFGDVGKGCAAAMKGCGAVVYIAEVDPICALQAAMEGFRVVRIESVVKEIDIFISATGNKNIVMASHMALMKNNAIVGNIGHFDNEVDILGLSKVEGIKRITIKPQVDKFVFPDGHAVIILAEGRLLNLGCATGHPSFVMSCSFTNQVLAQMEIWVNRKEQKYSKDVYLLPKHLDEMVAKLHLKSLGCELSELTPEQAAYLDIPQHGPFKVDSYRY